MKRKNKNKKDQEKKESIKKFDKWKPEKLNEGIKKVPLIVFGTEMFGKDSVKLKGNRVGVTGILYRALKKREAAGDLLVLAIDECKTSRVCNQCGSDSLEGLSHVKSHRVLACKTCYTLWHRDINASKNMMNIALSIWKWNGRPQAYSRK